MEGRDFLAPDHKPRPRTFRRDRCDYTIEKIRPSSPQVQISLQCLTDRPFMPPGYKDPWPVSQEFRRLVAEGKMNETQLVSSAQRKSRKSFTTSPTTPRNP